MAHLLWRKGLLMRKITDSDLQLFLILNAIISLSGLIGSVMIHRYEMNHDWDNFYKDKVMEVCND